MDETAVWTAGGECDRSEQPSRKYTSIDPKEDDLRYEIGLERDDKGKWEKLNPKVLSRIASTGAGLCRLRHFLGVDMSHVKWNRDVVDRLLDASLESLSSDRQRENATGFIYNGNPTENHLHVLSDFFAKSQGDADETKQYIELRAAQEKLNGLFKEIEDVAANLPDDFEQFRAFREGVKNDVRAFESTLRKKYRIIIVGEMKSGKSSLINALIGVTLMYVNSTPATTYVCEIHNIGREDRKRVEIIDKRGTILRCESFDKDKNDDHVARIVSNILGEPRASLGKDEDKSISMVKVYWPMPMLPENVVLVDTPGVNEGPAFMETVSAYLRKGQQFSLCGVINSITAAGDDTTKLIRVFTDKIKDACSAAALPETEEYRMKANLLKNSMFILNRWDQLASRPPIQDRPTEPFFEAFSTWVNSFWRIETILSELDLKGARVLRPEQLIPMSAENAYYASRLGLPSFYNQCLRRTFSSLAVSTQRTEFQIASHRLHLLLSKFHVDCVNFLRDIEPGIRDGRLREVQNKIKCLQNMIGKSDEILEDFRSELIEKLRELLTSGNRMNEVSKLIVDDVMNIVARDKSSKSMTKEQLAKLIVERLADRLRPDITTIARQVVFDNVVVKLQLTDVNDPESAVCFDGAPSWIDEIVFSIVRAISAVVIGAAVLLAIITIVLGVLGSPLWYLFGIAGAVSGSAIYIYRFVMRAAKKEEDAYEQRTHTRNMRKFKKDAENHLSKIRSNIDNHWKDISKELNKNIEQIWRKSIWAQVLAAIERERKHLASRESDLRSTPSKDRVDEVFRPLLTPLTTILSKLRAFNLLGDIPCPDYIDPSSLEVSGTTLGRGISAVYHGYFCPPGVPSSSTSIPVAVKIIGNVDVYKDAFSLFNELQVVRTSKLAPPEMWVGDWDPSIDYSAKLKKALVHFGGGIIRKEVAATIWPNIEATLSSSSESEYVAYIVSPLMDANAASRYLDGVHVPWKERLSASANISACIAALHDQGIVHRDIKPENFLIPGDATGPKTGKVVIADFGCTRLLDAANRTLCGTIPYFSPEQRQAMISDGKGLKRDQLYKSDVYSTAIVILEILHEKRLSRDPDFNPQEAITNLQSLNLHSGGSNDVASIQRMLSKASAVDPAERCSSKDLSSFFAALVFNEE